MQKLVFTAGAAGTISVVIPRGTGKKSWTVTGVSIISTAAVTATWAVVTSASGTADATGLSKGLAVLLTGAVSANTPTACVDVSGVLAALSADTVEVRVTFGAAGTAVLMVEDLDTDLSQIDVLMDRQA